jgi:hypothetical protein
VSQLVEAILRELTIKDIDEKPFNRPGRAFERFAAWPPNSFVFRIAAAR